jgi:hypothetical protein
MGIRIQRSVSRLVSQALQVLMGTMKVKPGTGTLAGEDKD